MLKLIRFGLIGLLGLLVACQTADPGDLPTPVLPDNLPTARPTAMPDSPETAESTPMPAVTTEPTTAVSSAVPASSLLPFAWDDREPYRTGLVDSEQSVLEQLPGATVYHMIVQIEAGLNVVTGRQEVRYTNKEAVSLEQVYFHLFPNLLGGQISVSNVRVNETAVSPAFESFNDSEMVVPLPAPLPPEGQVVIGMDFAVTVPQESGRNYGIFALLDDILALAHFYPMVAVYDANGWNVEEPSTDGDVTYGDTGFYLVQIIAPLTETVAASGVEIAREESGDTQTITVAAGPMRDFYTAVSSRFSVVSATVGQVRVNSYAPSEFEDGAARALTFATQSLEVYNGRFTPYPFTELDIVSTSTLALGIEYPGIIAITLREYDETAQTTTGIPFRLLMEGTVVHEVGHQWFYSLIGNDQLDEPWLDESITQYVSWLYHVDTYGKNHPLAEDYYSRLQGRWERTDFADIPIGLPVSAYQGAEYSGIIYGRGPVFVNTLAETVGQETFDAALRDYTMQYKWGVATTADFKQLVETHCQCDVTPLFTEWVYPK